MHAASLFILSTQSDTKKKTNNIAELNQSSMKKTIIHCQANEAAEAFRAPLHLTCDEERTRVSIRDQFNRRLEHLFTEKIVWFLFENGEH